MTAFDEAERRGWAGRAAAYASSFARLCAYPVPVLLDAAAVEPGTRLLDGTGTGTLAAAAARRGAEVSAVDAEPDMVAFTARGVPQADVRGAELPQLPWPDDTFNVTAANFVLNHVGSPRAALRELRRVTRPGGPVAVTIWSVPPGAGQALLGRALAISAVPRPTGAQRLPPDQDFRRDELGMAGLFASAGLADVDCRTLVWDHRANVAEWWSGPAGGVASVGQVLAACSAADVARVKETFDRLSQEFLEPGGLLVLPHRALMAVAVV